MDVLDLLSQFRVSGIILGSCVRLFAQFLILFQNCIFTVYRVLIGTVGITAQNFFDSVSGDIALLHILKDRVIDFRLLFLSNLAFFLSACNLVLIQFFDYRLLVLAQTGSIVYTLTVGLDCIETTSDTAQGSTANERFKVFVKGFFTE